MENIRSSHSNMVPTLWSPILPFTALWWWADAHASCRGLWACHRSARQSLPRSLVSCSARSSRGVRPSTPHSDGFAPCRSRASATRSPSTFASSNGKGGGSQKSLRPSDFPIGSLKLNGSGGGIRPSKVVAWLRTQTAWRGVCPDATSIRFGFAPYASRSSTATLRWSLAARKRGKGGKGFCLVCSGLSLPTPSGGAPICNSSSAIW
mmetsp:Transcript_56338/g.101260  ORF Transcript_56338/g.101260 Transcript_56338/m.101260 type:complete len:207 (-) Transcript_56338:276-896(-)